MPFLNCMNLVRRHVPAGLVQVVRRLSLLPPQGSDFGFGEQVGRDIVLFVQSREHRQDLRCTGGVAAIHPQQLHQPEFSRSNHEHAAIH